VDDIVLEQLGSSEAVLTPEEKDLGVAIIDIGGGTTDLGDLLKWRDQAHGGLFISGSHITNDISMGLRTPAEEAEKM